MTNPSFSPAPLVEHALQLLRDTALDPTPTPGPEEARTQATPDSARLEPDASQSKRDGIETEPEAEAVTTVKPDQPGVGALEALRALRAVSVSAQARLADPEEFPELPVERDLPDLGPYVEHVMREAQAAAAAYREEAARETADRAAKLLREATASAERIRQDADAYGERAHALADALLAERVRRIAELAERLSQMARRASEDFAEDQLMRDQMTRFISSLSVAAEEAVAEVFAHTTSGSQAPHTAGAAPRRTVRP